MGLLFDFHSRDQYCNNKSTFHDQFFMVENFVVTHHYLISQYQYHLKYSIASSSIECIRRVRSIVLSEIQVISFRFISAPTRDGHFCDERTRANT